MNSFLASLFHFFFDFEPQKKKKTDLRTQKEIMKMMRTKMMLLALALLFATPFSRFSAHGFYLPGVAPQGTNFLRLCVSFVLLRVLNVV